MKAIFIALLMLSEILWAAPKTGEVHSFSTGPRVVQKRGAPNFYTLNSFTALFISDLPKIWNDTRDLFVHNQNNADRQLFEKPSVIQSPLMVGALLALSDSLLERRPGVNIEVANYAAWLALTQALYALNVSAMTMQHHFQTNSGNGNGTVVIRYEDFTERKLHELARQMVYAVPHLNPEFAKTFGEEFVEMKAEFRPRFATLEKRLHYLTLSAQVGSESFEEPRLDDYDRILEMTQHEDVRVALIATLKLAQIAPVLKGERTPLAEKAFQRLEAILSDKTKDNTLRAAATFILSKSFRRRLPSDTFKYRPKQVVAMLNGNGLILQNLSLELLYEIQRHLKSASKSRGRRWAVEGLKFSEGRFIGNNGGRVFFKAWLRVPTYKEIKRLGFATIRLE